MTKNSGVSIDQSLFDWPSNNPHLKGSQCEDCKAVTFPVQDGCPRCCGTSMEQIPLETKGTLWSWTVQGFLPKSPPYAGPETLETFKPYGVGYIELEGQVRVESRLTESDPEKLKIGMPMELVFDKFLEDEEGNDIISFAFAPITGE